MNAVASETPQSLFFPSPVSTPDWTLEPQQLRRCDGGEQLAVCGRTYHRTETLGLAAPMALVFVYPTCSSVKKMIRELTGLQGIKDLV